MMLTACLCLLVGQASGQIEKFNMPSATMELDFPCPPEEITITKFKGGKNWKIVVNRPFDYKAAPKSGTDNWTWALGDLNATGDGVVPFWQFQNPLNAYSGTDMIPMSNLPPDNADFGPAHGHIEATANLNGVPKKDLSDPPVETVKVFFNKDEVHPVSGTPNWFHYWSKINMPQLNNYLTIPSVPVFDFGSCSFVPQPYPSNINTTLSISYDSSLPYNPVTMTGTMGINNFWQGTTIPATGCPGFGSVIANFDPSGVILGPGCSQVEPNQNNPANPYRGIHVFYRTVAHESEHARIAAEVWSTGWASNWDMDDDGYRDDWENQINANLPIGAFYQFSIGIPGSQNDIYQNGYDPTNLGQNPPLYTAGTEYEEWRCRQVEDNVNLIQINPFDWSFDPTGVNQGKQW